MVLTGYSLSLVQASWMTLQIAFASLLVGLLLALVFAGGEMAKLKLIKWPTTLLVTVFASYASQTLRGALKAVGRGQREAASALGIPPAHAFFRIVLPQAVRHALPGLMNQWLVLLKDTALVSLIGVTDLLKQAQLTSAATHEAFTWYATAAAVYLVITLITQRAVKVIDHKFAVQGMSHSQGASA